MKNDKKCNAMMNENVASIMSKNLITLNANDNLTALLEVMKQNRVHHFPVVEGKKLVGIVTTWDLLKLNRRFEDYESIKVSEVMTRKLAYLNPGDPIGSAAEVLLKNYFHAIPIVDDERNLIGIVTNFDILKYEYLKEYPNERLE